MKKFNFRLESLLKYREFTEKKLKEELGEINKRIQNLRERKSGLNSDIDMTYNLQENLGQNIEKAGVYQFVPQHILAKKMHISKTDKEIDETMKLFNEKVEELKKARGETKVVERLKEKEMGEYKKEGVRKEREFAEENYNMRKLSKNGGPL